MLTAVHTPLLCRRETDTPCFVVFLAHGVSRLALGSVDCSILTQHAGESPKETAKIPRQVTGRMCYMQTTTSKGARSTGTQVGYWLINSSQCDETRPKCGASTRLDTECLYLSPEKNGLPTHDEALAAPSAATRSIAPGSQGTSRSQDISESQETQGTLDSLHGTDFATPTSSTALDLELMADALLSDTSDDFPDHVNTREYMSKKAQLATTKTYLMHEMLAVSGLHRFSKDKARQELMTRALYHQSEALRLIQSQLASVSEDDCLALLFFTSYAAVCGLAEPAFCDTHDETFDPIEKLIHAVQLSRGITAIVVPHWSLIRQTWAWPVIASQIEAGSDLTPQPQSIPGYTLLRCLAFGLEHESDRQACLKALDFTLGAISMAQQRKDMSMSRRLVTSWPMETGTTFHTLLAERRPVSLVLVAYYAVLLKTGIGLWWVGRLPEALVNQVVASLGEEWADFVSWPLSVVRGDVCTTATVPEAAV